MPTDDPVPAPKPSFLSALVAALSSGTGRRLAVFLLGFLTVTLNKKLGLDLNPEALISDIVLVVGYLGQSAAKEASDAHAEAKLVTAESLAAATKAPVTP